MKIDIEYEILKLKGLERLFYIISGSDRLAGDDYDQYVFLLFGEIINDIIKNISLEGDLKNSVVKGQAERDAVGQPLT